LSNPKKRRQDVIDFITRSINKNKENIYIFIAKYINILVETSYKLEKYKLENPSDDDIENIGRMLVEESKRWNI
jgi:hypothetical protein